MVRRIIKATENHLYQVEIITKRGSFIETMPIDKTKMRIRRGHMWEVYLGGSWWLATEQEYNEAKAKLAQPSAGDHGGSR